ncbi:uncharacterized protein LOC124643097 [Helicoverpa zea]|uniref:uncharacterized protein LOC124643097 n=1 Tax=Helicoverpa zea TaxID=7113 RepID=UPI001F5A001E|nr:uncharacterized protein LOC124643097 [Helicoverpa zea]
MKLLLFFTASLLAGLAYSAPTSNDDDDTLVVTADFFPESLAVYTAEHDIVKLLVPLNALNFEDDADEEEESSSDSDALVFFVQADKNENGGLVDQGLFVLKNGQATKLLDHGRDAAAANDDTKTAYFAANDGIYAYNAKDNKAEKYGTVTDDLISIAKVNGSDILYILTADQVVYKVTEEGTKKEKLNQIVNAKELILDYQNNLYYYTNDNKVYVLVGDEVKQISGLPENASSVNIINPPFVIENGVPVIVDNKAYVAYENGTSELAGFDFQIKPTAYAMEATLIQFYAYEKKVYEYNVLTILFSELLSELKSYLEDKTDDIQAIATRSRSDLRA